LKKLIATQEPKIITSNKEFELKLAIHFKLAPMDKKPQIQERFQKETEEKQRLLEEDYLKKKAEEEEKKQALENAEKKPTEKGKEKKPEKKVEAKKGGKAKEAKEVAESEVPKIPVPEVVEYTSPAGEKYVVEYTLDQLADSLMKTEEELERIKLEDSKKAEEKKKQEAEVAAAAAPSKEKKGSPGKPKPAEKKNEEQLKKEEEEKKKLQEEDDKLKKSKEEEEKKLKLKRSVPMDPAGKHCLHENLLIDHNGVVNILSGFLTKLFAYIADQKKSYLDSLRDSNSKILTKNMSDVDTLFQKSWPGGDKIEIDVFYLRQSEIANHKKIYDKHVRSILKKNDTDEKSFVDIVKEFKSMMANYDKLMGNLMAGLESFTSLAELQGFLRKAKEAYNILTERKELFAILGGAS
jgi:hypothetical protein